jgi:hypothetical protein
MERVWFYLDGGELFVADGLADGVGASVEAVERKDSYREQSDPRCGTDLTGLCFALDIVDNG